VTRRTLLPLLVLLPLVGCGPPPAATRPPVDIGGKMTTAQGKGVGNVMLTLHPQDADAKGQQPMALVKADGTFATRCIPGTYKVTLTPLPNAPGDGSPGAGTAPPPAGGTGSGMPGGNQTVGGIPAAYTNAASTPWQITVKDGANDEFKLSYAR
jgi:hypothetical protein